MINKKFSLVALLRGLAFNLFIVLAIFFYGAPLLILGLLFRKKLIFKRIPGFFDLLYKILGVELVVEGKEHKQGNQAYLVLSNHQSYLDIPIIMKAVGSISFLAKIEIRSWFLFGLAMDQMDCIFVDRTDSASRRSVGPRMLGKIREGISYCVFPEGTRTRTGQIQEFKKGIFTIAKGSGIPILPVTICGAFNVLPRKSKQMYSGSIRCIIHPPVNPPDFATTDELLAFVESTVRQPLKSSTESA